MDLSLQKLSEALSIRQQIDSLERRLYSLFADGGSTASTSHKGGSRKRKPMSAATREKIAAAARTRWARRKVTAPRKIRAKKKGGLTSMGRKKLSDAMTARWAARRGSKKKKRPPTRNLGTFHR
jgi:hypothetical protein